MVFSAWFQVDALPFCHGQRAMARLRRSVLLVGCTSFLGGCCATQNGPAGWVQSAAIGSLAALLPSPSCMLNNESCPIPRGWVADWSMINSTAMMAIGAAGYSPDSFDPQHRWGYVTLDWSTGWTRWMGNSTDPAKASCEATSSANCVRLKQADKVKRCGIYHNMELSLQWLESERAVMDDAHVKAGWFLQYPNGAAI